jgi:hypothetical protein
MDPSRIQPNLPPFHQKMAVVVLAVAWAIWIFRLVRARRVREEHALLWFLGLGASALVVWCDRVLVAVSGILGIDVPASALLLLALLFLFIVAVRLTSEVSSQKAQVAKLTVLVSILRARLPKQSIGDRREG